MKVQEALHPSPCVTIVLLSNECKRSRRWRRPFRRTCVALVDCHRHLHPSSQHVRHLCSYSAGGTLPLGDCLVRFRRMDRAAIP